MAEKTKQGRLDAATMYPMMELYEESQMTQKQFCLEMDIVPHTFTYWLSKYRKSKKRSSPASDSKNEFIELAVASTPSSSNLARFMRITYPDGTKIELPVR